MCAERATHACSARSPEDEKDEAYRRSREIVINRTFLDTQVVERPLPEGRGVFRFRKIKRCKRRARCAPADPFGAPRAVVMDKHGQLSYSIMIFEVRAGPQSVRVR